MTSHGPLEGKVYSIPGSQGFAIRLAEGIKARYGDEKDPLALTRVKLFVPTRRAVQALTKAFQDLEPTGISLMPQILPLGDVSADELEAEDGAGSLEQAADLLNPAISSTRRQLILARLLTARKDFGSFSSPASMAALAVDLAHFFDNVQTEKADLSGLDRLVPEEFASHWQQTIKFLRILTDVWPGILDEIGVLDPAFRRSEILRRLAERWRNNGLDGPVIIAGSTGSIPATQELMRAVVSDAKGALVLPGLDHLMADDVWQVVDESHPQFGLKHLLKGLDLTRDDVLSWSEGESEGKELAARRAVLHQMMLPAEATEGWLAFTQDERVKETLGDAFKGLSRIEAHDIRLEALTIALIMRETLEAPGKTVALVTPDRNLARRVSSELRRWGLEVDDSAGMPLANTTVGSFLTACLDVVDRDFAPVPLLALLKHPLAGLGWSRPHLRHVAAQFEIEVLRGIRPPAGLSGLRQKAEAVDKELQKHKGAGLDRELFELLDRLDAAFQPYLDKDVSTPSDLVRAHIELLEALSESQADGAKLSGAGRLWVGEAGEAAALFLGELLEEADDLGTLAREDYPAFFDVLLQSRIVRPHRGVHPRAYVWGPLEARLQSADVVILGGLNEKSWPQLADADPWLSRPMRAALGMSQPERRIGQSAHDFVQLASAGHVYLTRSLKVDGAPTVASRWLMRLENMLEGLKSKSLLEPGRPYLAWAEQLDRPTRFLPVEAPRPTPPIAARPRQLSVTEIETWLRDPYAIYGRRVLRLRPLDALDLPVGPFERGTAIHEALERFLGSHMDDLPDEALDVLLEEGGKAFAAAGASEEVLAFWLPRFERLAAWFIAFEEEQRERARPLVLEAKGRLTLSAPHDDFVLTARGDRFDLFSGKGKERKGGVGVYDYKTGQPPSLPQIEALLAPQLPLEALVAEGGGFEGLSKVRVEEIGYIRVSGGREPGEFMAYSEGLSELVEIAKEALEGFITAYDNPEMPYLSRVMPMFDTRIGPYDHLARVREWSVYGREEGGSE